MSCRVLTCLLLIGAICFCPGIRPDASAQEVVAVLSSELGPYLEAFEGFRETMGHPVPVVSLSAGQPRIGRKTRVVVAFGSKAALESFPPDVALIYCMAPGTRLDPEARPGPTVKISMLPQARVMLAALRELQPGLSRLAVFWVLEAAESYLEQMHQAGKELGIEIAAEKLEHVDELPDRLRALVARGADALWVPPDPLLINAQSFSVIREFSWANDVPFFAPTAGFVEEGAVAAIAVGFPQIGVAAAMAAQQILAGESMPGEIYPEASEITLNLKAAANAGLHIPPEVSRGAHKVVP